MRTILHVDMDAFFAAVEQREHPELRGKPVIVGADPQGGKGRGVVAACSYEARGFGIHSAMPITHAWRRCPHAVYLPPTGKLYARVSRRVMAIFSEYTDLLEQISIDEAFLDVTASFRLFGSGEEIARAIKARTRQQEQLTASVGIASNKFIAKIASDLNKPDGLVVVPSGTERQFLAPLPVSRIWGVGEKTEAVLKAMGWRTIGQLAALPQSVLEARLGEHGRHLWELGNGLDPRPVIPEEDYKSIGHEMTYDHDTDDPRVWHATLLELTERVAQRLRRYAMAGRTVTLKVRYDDFTTFTRRKTTREVLSTTEEIYPVVEKLLAEFLKQSRKLRLLGVYVSQLGAAGAGQKTLFDAEHRKLESLSQAVDRLEERYGQGVIRRATLVRKQ